MPDETRLAVTVYPGPYTFRVVVTDLPHVRLAVREILQGVVNMEVPESAMTERPSANGKYVALHVSCHLESEDQRRTIYETLKAQAFVMFML
jgi:putative lipoic acid-binding regulatory protein